MRSLRPSVKQHLMHALFAKAQKLSYEAIGAAIEVHRHKGAGLIESIYEKCLIRELSLRSISCVNQKVILIEYKGYTFEEPLRFDLLVEGCLLLELKSVERLLALHHKQLLSYMRVSGLRAGLLVNFNVAILPDGLTRKVL